MFTNVQFDGLFIVLVAMVISITLHEVMHGFVAHQLGDSTAKEAGRLSLNPLKHVDILTTILLPVVLLALHLPPIFIAKPVPFDPDKVRYGEYGAALVGIAGPLTNLLLAVMGAAVLQFGNLGGEPAYALFLFIQINVALFVFNMIPFPPLDGSRLLYAVAPDALRRLMYDIERAGLAITVMVFLLLSPFILPVIRNISNAILGFLLR